MKRMGKLLLVVLFVWMLQLSASAEAMGYIQVNLKGGGKPISGADVRVYFTGTPTEAGYRLTDTFGGGLITQLDVFSPELAVWLSQRASGGWQGTTDKNGSVRFEGLEEGLYLVMQPASKGGYHPFEPFLVTLPWDGDQWGITATPKTEREITVVPDTSDPGTVDKGLRGMLFSGMGLLLILLSRKKWLA